ncbi:GNAT family N-acetyltransferase [Planosporangium sp. 12N6]|uniref:GNAT family N-acetyltransferase n=1 Tax=Planosporangium spinosum TaxID=3402278 RepID=UPI003CEFFCC6
MQVREWDPAAAPAEEIAGVLRTLNMIIATDMPEDPPWRTDSFREYLAVTMPDERRVCWIAVDGDDLLGYATILLVGDIAVLELLVRPDARRSGVGTALLAAAARRARAEGYDALGVEVVGGTPAPGFFEALGFRCAFVEMRNVLDLSTVDWDQLGTLAEGVGSGYRIEYYPGGPPEPILDEYAGAKATMRLDPSYDLDLRPSSYDSDRLRASLATLHARGLKPHVVLAVHEQSGAVAGLTEVVVPAQRPTRADQYDTVVVRSHRGYGLGRALKARMLTELRAAEPQLLDVQTWNAVGADALLRINDELGFKPDREWREYEADVDEVLRHLDQVA